jgi:Fe(3+) dicitrate transport protein
MTEDDAALRALGTDSTGPLRVLEAIASPLFDPNERLFLPYLIVALVLGAALARRVPVNWRGWTTSCTLDAQLWLVQRLLPLVVGGASLGSALGLAHATVRAAHALCGVSPFALAAPTWTLLYTVGTFITQDASRYLVHRWLHRSPTLWAFHQVHHSADALTPLTFHRVHPVETALYAARSALVNGGVAGVFFWASGGQVTAVEVLGVNAIAFGFQAIAGNLRHSPVAWGWGDVIERWWLSPAQHQVHHGRGTDGTNFGTWLALWDRLGGTLRLSSQGLPHTFGLDARALNHDPASLASALIGPFRVLLPFVRRALAACGLWSATAHAEDEATKPKEDSDVIVVVGKDGQIPTTAGSATVITEAELKRHDYTDIHRVLAKVPGVYLRDEDGFGLRPNIGIRGANSDRSAKVALTEDGVLFAPAPYSAPAGYYFPMMPRIVGVEVLKGPAAISQGPNTIGGAINLRTRAVPDRTAFALDAAGGSFGTRRAHGYVGSSGKHLGFLFEGAHVDTDGFKQLDGGGDTGFRQSEGMFKLRWRDAVEVPTHTVELKLGAAFERSNETYLGLTDADFAANPDRRYAASALDVMRWHREQAVLSWTYATPNLDLRTTAYLHTLDRAWTRLNGFAGGPDLGDVLRAGDTGQSAVYLAILRGEADSTTDAENLQIVTNDRSFRSFGVQTRGIRRWSLEKIRHRLEFGLRAHGDAIQRHHAEVAHAMRDGRPTPTDPTTDVTLENIGSAHAFSGFASDAIELGAWRWLPGVRVEAIGNALDDLSDATSPTTAWRTIVLPGFAADFRPDGPWSVFAGIHRGFSPVAPGETDETQPETSTNAELGGRYGVEGFHAELIGFANDYANITGQCTMAGVCSPEMLDRQFNGGRAVVGGVEASVGASVPLGRAVTARADLAYGNTQTAFRTSFNSAFPQFGSVQQGDAFPYLPAHQGSLRLRVEAERFDVSAAIDGRSAMRDRAGQGEIPALELLPGVATVDLAAGWRPTAGWEIRATVQNATDQRVIAARQPFGGRPNPPRMVQLGARFRWGGE